MKILVTGAAGQIGRFVMRKLLETNVDCIGLDIRNSNLKSKLLKIQLNNKEDLNKNKQILKEFDTLIHLASKINIDPNVLKSGKESTDLNLVSTLNLLEYMPSLKHICFTSSYMVYGHPISNPVKEAHQTNPNSVYGASKLATEKFLQIFSEQYRIPISILRLMGVYDLENPYNQAIPSFIKLMANNQSPKIFGDGKIRRNHLHINDAVDSILKSVHVKKSGIYNIGGLDSPSNLRLIEIINNELKTKIEPKFETTENKQYDFITDITKAKNELDFIPRVKIEDGISSTIQRYKTIGW